MSGSEPIPLNEIQKTLKSLAATLDKIEKAEVLLDRAAGLETAIELVRRQQWDRIVDSLSEHLGRTQGGINEALSRKREEVLQKLDAKGIPTQRRSDYDRAGPLRIIHKGARTTLRFGNLELTSFLETDSEKIAGTVASEVKNITQGDPKPENFSRILEIAFEHAHCEKKVGADSWIRLTDLYREFWLAAQRLQFSGKLPKEPKNLDYPLVRFAISLAQWMRTNPKLPSGALLRMRTPPMSQESEALLIPNLSNPLGNEELLLEGKLDKSERL